MKRNSARKRLNTLIGIASLCWVLPACAILEEGCLDVYGLNFSIDVDKSCDACCTYPQLRLDVLHKISVGDSLQNINLKSGVYADGAGNPIRFQDIRFYISEVHLVKTDGSLVVLREMLQVRSPDSSRVTVENNVALVTPTSLARIVLGTFRKGDQVSAVRFKLGIGTPTRSIDPTSAPTTHPLYPQPIAMWSSNQGYTAQRIALFPGISAADTIPIVFETTGTSSLREVELQLPQPVSIPAGYHIALTLRIDYAQWLAGVNILRDPTSSILQKLGDNVAPSFEITQVVVSEN